MKQTIPRTDGKNPPKQRKVAVVTGGADWRSEEIESAMILLKK